MKPSSLLLAGLLATLHAAAAAAEAPDAIEGIESELRIAQAPVARGGARVVIGDGDTLAFAADELGGERLVKGAPYCAEALQESVQTLTDGNRIVRRHSTRHCRDGEGRTRQELDRNGRTIVYLRDPVSRESWVLDPARKTARRLGTGVGPGPEASAWREYADRMREWARTLREQTPAGRAPPSAQPAPPAPPAPALIQPGAPLGAPPAPGAGAEETNVVVMRVDGAEAPLPPLPALPALPPMITTVPEGVAWRAQIGAPRGPGAVTSLGSKEIEGLKVNGERTTWTIEAGKLGNEKPIVITRDVWTSPELLLTVLTRDADPRVGETTYRLVNVRRGEPDPASMRVPADHARTPAATPER